MKPRRDVIVRRFLAGWSFRMLMSELDCDLEQVEDAIRWSFEKLGKAMTDPRRWAPVLCTNNWPCPLCYAKRGELCATDRPLHLERWDEWRAAGFPEVAP